MTGITTRRNNRVKKSVILALIKCNVTCTYEWKLPAGKFETTTFEKFLASSVKVSVFTVPWEIFTILLNAKFLSEFSI